MACHPDSSLLTGPPRQAQRKDTLALARFHSQRKAWQSTQVGQPEGGEVVAEDRRELQDPTPAPHGDQIQGVAGPQAGLGWRRWRRESGRNPLLCGAGRGVAVRCLKGHSVVWGHCP